MPLRRATTETPLPGLEALVHHGQFLLDTPAATPLLAEHFDSLSLLVVINTVVSLSLMERKPCPVFQGLDHGKHWYTLP